MLTWDFHFDDSDQGRYNMIIGRDLLTGLHLNFSEHVVKGGCGPLKGYITPIIDLGM